MDHVNQWVEGERSALYINSQTRCSILCYLKKSIRQCLHTVNIRYNPRASRGKEEGKWHRQRRAVTKRFITWLATAWTPSQTPIHTECLWEAGKSTHWNSASKQKRGIHQWADSSLLSLSDPGLSHGTWILSASGLCFPAPLDKCWEKYL